MHTISLSVLPVWWSPHGSVPMLITGSKHPYLENWKTLANSHLPNSCLTTFPLSTQCILFSCNFFPAWNSQNIPQTFQMLFFTIKKSQVIYKISFSYIRTYTSKIGGIQNKRVKSLKKNIFINVQQFYINTGDMLA